jgi:DNA-binding response OmpR family regulator
MKRVPKILVVDDEPKACDLLRLNLEPQGFSVISATNGDDAIRLAWSEKPDFIILDICMKGKDGWEVCRILRVDADMQRIPIIIVTAFSRPSDFEKAKSLGVKYYFSKPINPNSLIESIDAILQENIINQFK